MHVTSQKFRLEEQELARRRTRIGASRAAAPLGAAPLERAWRHGALRRQLPHIHFRAVVQQQQPRALCDREATLSREGEQLERRRALEFIE